MGVLTDQYCFSKSTNSGRVNIFTSFGRLAFKLAKTCFILAPFLSLITHISIFSTGRLLGFILKKVESLTIKLPSTPKEGPKLNKPPTRTR